MGTHFYEDELTWGRKRIIMGTSWHGNEFSLGQVSMGTNFHGDELAWERKVGKEITGTKSPGTNCRGQNLWERNGITPSDGRYKLYLSYLSEKYFILGLAILSKEYGEYGD